MQRAFTFLAALCVSLGALVATPSKAAAASNGPCVTDDINARFDSWTEKSSVSKNVRNIRAKIQVSSPVSQFRPCSWSLGLDSSSAWVAIVPGSGNPNNNDKWSILQVGIIACNATEFGACRPNTDHYFWAEGGCPISPPDPQDLGLANTSLHDYQIRHYSDGTYDLRIDSVSKISFLDYADHDVGCWITHNYDNGQWAYERNDRGDGLGDTTHKAAMNPTYMMWYDPGDTGTWASPAFDDCNAAPSDHPGVGSCSYGPNYLYGWTNY